MPNFNRATLIGNLTGDPDLVYLPQSQTPVCNFTVATNRTWKNKDGEQKKESCFVGCQAFAGIGETINKYFHKGNPIFVDGHLRLNQWEDSGGQSHSRLYLVIDSFQFLTAKKTESES